MLRLLLCQRSMFEVNPDAIRLAPDAFERLLPDLVPKLVSASDFRGFYSEEHGGGSRCPLMLVAMLLLQFRYNVSDRELIKRCRRDLGWRFAIGLEADREPPGQATLQRFRRKLCNRKGVDFLHRRSLMLARASGFLKDIDLQVVDSTNTSCRGAVIDTYNLVAAGIRQVIRITARCLGYSHVALAERWGLSRYTARSIKGQVAIDWSDAAARNALITEEINDADGMAERVAGLNVTLPGEVNNALTLLSKVAHQDVEQLADGSYRITQGTTAGRTISMTDPEARHGRKSSSKVIKGFKTHIMGTIASQFVTGIAITDASKHDSHATPALIDQTKKYALKPHEVLGDAAYGTGANIRNCQAKGVAVLAKQGAASHKGSLPKSSFDIELTAMRVTCPAGQTTQRYTDVKDRGGTDQRVACFHFDKQACQACSLKQQCCSQTKKGRNRTITLNVHEPELQTLKAFNASERAPSLLRSRSSVERLISHLVRMGMRHARFFTMHKVQLQAHLTAAAYNLQRIITLMANNKKPRPVPL